VGLHTATAAGDVVLSGSFTWPLECRSGDGIAADFRAFGTVTVGFV
jgi:2-keto-4-pentenoate hydratase